MGFLVFLTLIAGAVYIGVAHSDEVRQCWRDFLRWCRTLGWTAAVVVALATWLVTSLGLPASPFFVGSAAIFSSLYGASAGAGIAIASCGVGFWAGCVSAFVLARHVMGDSVQRKLDKFEVVRVVNMIIESEGWKFAFLMRLSPFMPVEVFNFACALTPMSTRQNALACLGSLPTASVEIWMYAQVADAAGGGARTKSDNNSLLIMIAINVPILLLIIFLVQKANKKYREKVEGAAAPLPSKDTLKHASHYHGALRKVSTFSRASRALGTHQAWHLALQSIKSGWSTISVRRLHRAKTLESMPPLGSIGDGDNAVVRRSFTTDPRLGFG
mmetsp:Transcript_139015/g.432500  ORF Transcript_139015/g.432500 Transcript_139015/m.432500 type:complete len:329 (+) Transcript_139015:985-1971(+)